MDILIELSALSQKISALLKDASQKEKDIAAFLLGQMLQEAISGKESSWWCVAIPFQDGLIAKGFLTMAEIPYKIKAHSSADDIWWSLDIPLTKGT